MAAAAEELPAHSDNVDEEVRRIQLALEAVFSPTPAQDNPSSQQWFQQRQLADRYLTSFQTSAVSWMVCDRLLQDNGPTTNNNTQENAINQQRRFFAAQTLHTKCRADAYQLPADTLPSLRDSLVNHLTRYSMVGDMALTTRLAMCVSALAVQMSWTTIVTDLLGSLSDSQNRTVVMLLLRVLPEECASDRLVLLDENVRYYMRDHFVSTSPMVVQFLHEMMQQGQQATVFEALHTWIRYVPVQPDTIAQSPLLDAAVHGVTQPQTLEMAVDVLVEILRMYPSHHYANQGLVNKMIPSLSQLPLEQALASEDEDIMRAYCRIVTEMGESYMSLILSTENPDSSRLVDWVLRCSGIPEKEVASITLHFWYRMVLDLESVDPYDARQDLIDKYTPHLLQLIDVCTTVLMKYPLDIADLTEDRVDDIKRDRFYVAETIEDCCQLLGGQVVIQRVGTLLRNECQRVASTQQSEWQGIESCLACIQSIHRFISSDEGEFLPFCFSLISQLPQDIVPLRCTVSKLIGKYASWLAANPQVLQPLLPYLAQGLSIAKCAPAAAVAIKELCECSNQQMSMGEPVLQLYHEITAEPGRLDLKDELEVLEGVCRAVSRQIHETQDSGGDYVKRIVQPIGNRLAASVADQNSNPQRHIVPEIERLTVVVRFLTIQTSPTTTHPVVDIIKSCMGLLDAASNRFPKDNALAEKICRLHKHALRTCGSDAYAPMLNALIDQLVRSFESTRQSPFLYAASICVTEYGRDPSYSETLFTMINRLATTSFTFLHNRDDLTHHPDVVEELFYLMGRMMSHCPNPLVQSPLLRSLFQCAAVGMELDHRDANKGTLNFLENSISYGLSLREMSMPESQIALEQVLASEGQAVVNNLARALMGDLPAYSVDHGHGSISGIIWKLNLLCPGLMSTWMGAALAGAPERVRGDFMGALDSGLHREDFNLAVRGFMSACDRHRKLQHIRH